MKQYSLETWEKQKRAFEQKKEGHSSIHPLKSYAFSADVKKFSSLGETLLAQGKVGALILAGGVGSRLGFEGPKGAFVFPTLKKSLFQILFEKVKAASLKANRMLPIALMTSEQNHAATLLFIETHRYFGLSKEQVTLFIQDSLPYLNEKGEWIKKGEEVWDAPAGNGRVFHAFHKQGLWEKWKEKGIEQINVIPIDNPLADPFDPLLCGFHTEERNEITLKCIQKEDPQENVGLVVQSADKVRIIEYTELEEEKKVSFDREGKLEFSIANAGLYAFDFSFVKELASSSLPLHFVKKQVAPDLFAWKGEYYIFDLLAFASKVGVIVYPRKEIFCPLKTSADIPLIERAL